METFSDQVYIVEKEIEKEFSIKRVKDCSSCKHSFNWIVNSAYCETLTEELRERLEKMERKPFSHIEGLFWDVYKGMICNRYEVRK